MLFTKDKDLDWNWTRIKVAFSSSPFFDEYFWTSSFFDFFIPFGDFSAGNGADWIEKQLRYPRDTTAICPCTPGHRAFRTEFREGWMIFSLVYFRKRSNCSRWLLEIIIKSYNWILQHGGKMIMYIFSWADVAVFCNLFSKFFFDHFKRFFPDICSPINCFFKENAYNFSRKRDQFWDENAAWG